MADICVGAPDINWMEINCISMMMVLVLVMKVVPVDSLTDTNEDMRNVFPRSTIKIR